MYLFENIAGFQSILYNRMSSKSSCTHIIFTLSAAPFCHYLSYLSYLFCSSNVELSMALTVCGDRGSTVVKVLRYNSEGRWFDPSWCQWIFIDIKSFRSHNGPGVDSASNRNEYQAYFLGVKAPGT